MHSTKSIGLHRKPSFIILICQEFFNHIPKINSTQKVMKKSLILLAFLCTFFSAWSQKETTGASFDRVSSARLELLGGIAILPESAGTVAGFGGQIYLPLNICKTRNRPIWCWGLRLPWWWWRPYGDPWRKRPPIIVWPPFPGPGPDTAPWDGFDVSQVEIGQSIMFNPGVQLDLFPQSKLGISLFAGGGFKYEKGNSTEIANFGKVETFDKSVPVLSYGIGANYNLSDKIGIKAEVQSMTVYSENLQVHGPDGSVATFHGAKQTMPVFSAGLTVGL
jgi:hypothetical protein